MTRKEYEAIMAKIAEVDAEIVMIANAIDLDLILDVEDEEDENV